MTFIRENALFLTFVSIFVAVPWVTCNGLHLLLFNFSHHRLEIGFTGIEAGLFGLVLSATVAALGAALVAALSLSRFYCGTLCPNTLLARLRSFLNGKKGSVPRKIGGFLVLGTLSFLLAFSAVSYGVSTHELLNALRVLSFAGWLTVFLAVLIIAEVYMVQGWYCAYLCPYGAITAILPAEDRLGYTFSDPDHRCTGCGACVRICPIPALDIRAGFDTRCIQCGMCEGACSKIFASSDKGSLIVRASRSVFSAGGRGKGPLTAIIAVLAASIFGIAALLDTARLDSCLLENRPLYTQTSAQ